MPVESRYNKVKRTRKHSDAEESWKAPAMWSDKRSEVVRAAVNSVDKIARDLECKWGIGKLEELAPPKLAVAFEQARQNFSDAANGDDHNYLVQKANNLIEGWKALERSALKNGRNPADEDVWYAIAPPDVGGKAFAIVKHSSDAAAVDRNKYPRVYSLDEVARILAKFEIPLIEEIKTVFPNSKVTKIGSNSKDDFNDPIPF